MTGKWEGGYHHPFQFVFFHVTYLSLVIQPMTRDPFFSIKPSNSAFPFHSSLQASKQRRSFMTDQEKVECVICLEPVTSQSVLACCHQPGHSQCVSQWRKVRHTISCPHCRQAIPITVLDVVYPEL